MHWLERDQPAGAPLKLVSGRGPEEKAGQLAASLEGQALQVLLDLDPAGPYDIKELATAFSQWFRKVEPEIGLRHRLVTRSHASEEKLWVLATDGLYLARRGYPGLGVLPLAKERTMPEADQPQRGPVRGDRVAVRCDLPGKASDQGMGGCLGQY
ncbi:UNVERIFIED_CONTAM: hypothetical protein FKN15_021930 [Acipenser sinensis]